MNVDGEQIWEDGRLVHLYLTGDGGQNSYAGINMIPESISNLSELRYLKFKYTNIENLPESCQKALAKALKKTL